MLKEKEVIVEKIVEESQERTIIKKELSAITNFESDEEK